jgi:hypothetical protein
MDRTLQSITLVVLVGGCWVQQLSGQPPPRRLPIPEEKTAASPRGPQPVQCLAVVDDTGQLVLRRIVKEFRTEKRLQTIDGEEQEVTVRVPLFREVMDRHALRTVQGFRATGQRLAQESLAALLTEGCPVLVSADGQQVDPFYLQIVKDDTVVLIVNPSRGPAPAARAPTGAPISLPRSRSRGRDEDRGRDQGGTSRDAQERARMEAQRRAVRAAQEFARQQAAEAEREFQTLIKQLPEDVRKELKEAWEELDAQQKKEFLKSLRKKPGDSGRGA